MLSPVVPAAVGPRPLGSRAGSGKSQRPARDNLTAWFAVLIHGVQLHRDFVLVLIEQQDAVAVFAMSRSRNGQLIAEAIMVIPGTDNPRNFAPLCRD